MRPTELYMENFMSYENGYVNFRDMDVAAIIGQNGAGKSTILQAITYALWGQVRTTSHNDVVRRGSSKCLVRLDFMVGGQEYTLTRERDLSGRGTSNLTFGHVDGTIEGEFHHILTRPTIKETQEEIDKIIGMSYNVFANSVLLQQGEAANFSDAPPAKRKELIGELIGLEELQAIEKRAREALSEVEQEFKSTAYVLGNIDEELDDLDGSDKDYETSKSLQERLTAEVKKARDTLSRAKNDLAEIKAKQAELDGVSDKWDALVKSRDTIRELLGKRKAAADGYRAIVGTKPTIIAQIIELERLEDDVERMENVRDIAEKQDEADRLARERAELMVDVEKFEGEYIEINDKIEALDEVEEKLQNKYMADCEEIAREDGIKTGFVLMRDMFEEEERKHCPLCHQDIQDGYRFLESLQDSITDKEGLIKILKGQLKKTQARIAEDGRTMRQYIIDRERKAQLVSFTGSKIEAIDQRIGELDIKARVEFDEDIYWDTVERVEELTPARYGMGRINDADRDLAVALVEIEDLETKEADLTTQIKKTYSRVKKVELELSNLYDDADVELAIETLKLRIGNLEHNLQEAMEKAATAKANIERRKQLEAKYESLEADAAKLNDSIGLLDALVQATSKTGAQALLIEAALPGIEKDANEFLAEMSPNMSLAFESQKTTLKGSVSETLDVRVMVDGQTAPIETLSGGERFRADLSIRLAIGKLLTRRSGAKAEMLAIDEGFGSQDNDGLESIINTVYSLKNMFPLILVITHVDKVASSFDHVIQVKKERGRSTLTS